MFFLTQENDYHKDVAGYFFGNMYILQIQHGIQSLHCATNMGSKYGRDDNTAESVLYYDWIDRAKTVQLFNGGMQDRLEKIYSFLELACPILGLPYAKFNEEQRAMNGTLTSVGFIARPEDLDLDSSIIDTNPSLRLNKIKLLPGFDTKNTRLTKHDAKLLLAIIMHKARYA